MQSPLISCIVPVYNGERYLGEAIDSILAQTYGPLEIIVVDDGSTDGTAEVVATYGDQVRYLWQPNAGQAAARNHGLSVTQGEFISFLDADDLWHPEKLDRQIARFRTRAELEFCVTHVQNFWIPDLAEEEKRFRDHRISKPPPQCDRSGHRPRRFPLLRDRRKVHHRRTLPGCLEGDRSEQFQE